MVRKTTGTAGKNAGANPNAGMRALADELVGHAHRARQNAYAPYSQFLVGAALLCDDGTVIPGCNVENASYGLCICAERNAVGTAVGSGRRKYVAIAISTSSDPPSPPCGMCRQVLAEFAEQAPGGDIGVILENTQGKRITTTAKALLPGGFTPTMLASGVTASKSKKKSRKRS